MFLKKKKKTNLSGFFLCVELSEERKRIVYMCEFKCLNLVYLSLKKIV